MRKIGDHPAQFSAEVLAAIRLVLVERAVERVFDPFAGPGLRLAELCDELHVGFRGCDIEDWPRRDRRVQVFDATQIHPDIFERTWVVTSPTFANGINDHFEPKDTSTRYTYRVALGRPLHERNTGRYSIRGGNKAWDAYWDLNEEAVALWKLADGAIVNVKDFIHDGEEIALGEAWSELLRSHDFNIEATIRVPSRGLRNGENHAARVDFEHLIVATH